MERQAWISSLLDRRNLRGSTSSGDGSRPMLRGLEHADLLSPQLHAQVILTMATSRKDGPQPFLGPHRTDSMLSSAALNSACNSTLVKGGDPRTRWRPRPCSPLGRSRWIPSRNWVRQDAPAIDRVAHEVTEGPKTSVHGEARASVRRESCVAPRLTLHKSSQPENAGTRLPNSPCRLEILAGRQ